MHGVLKTTSRRRQRRVRPLIRRGQCQAAVRAITAATLYLDKRVSTLQAAAAGCGSNVAYVRAALVLLRSEDGLLFHAVRAGVISLPQAAAQVRPRVDLIAAYYRSGPEDRVAFGREVGAEALFTTCVEPAIG